MKVSAGILKDLSSSRSYSGRGEGAHHTLGQSRLRSITYQNCFVTSLFHSLIVHALVHSFAVASVWGYVCGVWLYSVSGKCSKLRHVTWKMVYMVTVSGRLPEYSETLKMSMPHLLMSSNSCQWTICIIKTSCTRSEDRRPVAVRQTQCWTSSGTLARSPSWLALTPKRGMVEGARLGLWVAFFTPLIWDMGRFFLSFSLVGGDMMSMSCCFSVGWIQTNYYQRSSLCKIFSLPFDFIYRHGVYCVCLCRVFYLGRC